MTPKEKAIDLIEKFYNIYGEFNKETFMYKLIMDNCKDCALIAVDEILIVLTDYVGNEKYYWDEVKQEIEKL